MHTLNDSQQIIGLASQGIFNTLTITRWSDISDAFNSLDSSGTISASLISADHNIHLSQNSNVKIAIGSTFKLYVLGALEQSIADQKNQWSDLLPIQNSLKSPFTPG